MFCVQGCPKTFPKEVLGILTQAQYTIFKTKNKQKFTETVKCVIKYHNYH